jgi:hypothetical protein
LTGREAVCEQERNCAKSKSGARTWELGRAARVLQIFVVMNVVVVRRPKTYFEGGVEKELYRMLKTCGYDETEH